MPPTLANGKICYLELPAADAGNVLGLYQHPRACAPPPAPPESP